MTVLDDGHIKGPSLSEIIIAIIRPGPFTKFVFRITNRSKFIRRTREEILLIANDLRTGSWILLASAILVIACSFSLSRVQLQFGNRTSFIATATLFGLLAVAVSSFGAIQPSLRRYDRWYRLLSLKTGLPEAILTNIFALGLIAFRHVNRVEFFVILAWLLAIRSFCIAILMLNSSRVRILILRDLEKRLRRNWIATSTETAPLGMFALRVQPYWRTRWSLAKADALVRGTNLILNYRPSMEFFPKFNVTLETTVSVAPNVQDVVRFANERLKDVFVINYQSSTLGNLPDALGWFDECATLAVRNGNWREAVSYLRDYWRLASKVALNEERFPTNEYPLVGASQLAGNIPGMAFLVLVQQENETVVDVALAHLTPLLLEIRALKHGVFRWTNDLALPIMIASLHRASIRDALLVSRAVGGQVAHALITLRSDPKMINDYISANPAEKLIAQIKLLSVLYSQPERQVRLEVILDLLSQVLLVRDRWPDFNDHTVEFKRKLHEYYVSLSSEERWRIWIEEWNENHSPEMSESIQDKIRTIFYRGLDRMNH